MNQLKDLFAKAGKFALVSVLAMGLTMTVIGCKKDDDDDDDKVKYQGTVVEDGGTISGTQTGSISVPANATVTLSGRVLFPAGTVFEIKEGVTLKADSSTETYLIIDRGAQIDAQGTSTAPVVFTSDKAAGQRGSQDWGGIVINGYATINAGTGVADGEGNSGEYGGTNDADNSGTMRYVRIEFAGKLISGTDELNCLALQGVGNGTTLEYIQTHGGADDGIEPFGGNVNLKYVVATGNGDDQFDGTGGWRGNIQYVALASITGDEGIEWDNSSSNNDALPRTTVVASNVSILIGQNAGGSVTVRVGTNATFYNTYMYNGDIKVEDAATTLALNSFTVEGGVLNSDGNATVTGTPSTSTPAAGSYYLKGANDGLSSMAALAALGATAFEPTSSAATGQTPPSDAFFDASATFVGAVQSAAANWMTGWTSFPAN